MGLITLSIDQLVNLTVDGLASLRIYPVAAIHHAMRRP